LGGVELEFFDGELSTRTGTAAASRTIYEAFAAAARKFPDRPALVARLGGVLAAEADGDAPAD